MYKKILVPLDGSELAEKILSQVEDLAKCMQAEIALLTVGNVSHLSYIAEAAPSSAVKETIAALKAGAEKNLSKVSNSLKTKGLKATTLYREGQPAMEIIQCAADAKCDLIAMATHGRGEVAWVLGSVTEKVVTHSAVPVLVMRVIEPQPLSEKRDLFGGP